MEELQAKIDQQKQLLSKAKTTIDKLRKDNQEKQEIIEEERAKNEHLERIVTKYVNEDAQLVCERVLAKVKVEEIEWMCIRTPDQIEWIRQGEFDKMLDPELHQNVQLLDYSKTKDNLVMAIQQYEHRMKILQEDCGHTEQIIRDIKQQYLELSNESEKYKSDLHQLMVEITNQSESIRENLLLFSEESIRQDCEHNIRVALTSIKRFNHPQLQLFKNHIILMHQTIYDIMKNHQEELQQSYEQEQANQQKIKEIEEERKMEREQRQQHFDAGRQQIKQLENSIDELTKELRDKNQKLDIYNKEMKKNHNLQYIKNIVIRFFTEEQSVKDKTIPVIATVLQFTDQELETVQQAWRSQNSLIGRMFWK